MANWLLNTVEKNRQEFNKRTEEQKQSALAEIKIKREIDKDLYTHTSAKKHC
jgi:hypothetical protein